MEQLMLLLIPLIVVIAVGTSMALSSRRPMIGMGFVLSLVLIISGVIIISVDSEQIEKEVDFGQQAIINTTVIPHNGKTMKISMNEPKQRIWDSEDDEYEEKDIQNYQKYTTFIVNNTVNTFIFNKTDFTLHEAMIVSGKNLTITTKFKGEPFHSYIVSQPKIIEYNMNLIPNMMIVSGLVIFAILLSISAGDVYLKVKDRKEKRRIARSKSLKTTGDFLSEKEKLLEENDEEYYKEQKEEQEKLRKEEKRRKKYEITKYGDIPKSSNDYFLIGLFNFERALEECRERRKDGQWCKIKNYGTTNQTETGQRCCAVYGSRWNEYEQEEKGKPKWK